MTQVFVICEGATEEQFIEHVMADFLNVHNIFLKPSIIGRVGHQGGNVTLDRLAKDIRNLLNHPGSYCTTFFDFYGLPADFPGKKEAMDENGSKNKSACLLSALKNQLQNKLSENQFRRFIPYVQMYEFEALLFSDPEKLASIINSKNTQDFAKIREQFENPEEINDSVQTAPSKRIHAISRYNSKSKITQGQRIAKSIGINKIREECPLFNAWLSQLEQLKPLQKFSEIEHV